MKRRPDAGICRRGRIVDKFGGNSKGAKFAVFQGANPVFDGAVAVRWTEC